MESDSNTTITTTRRPETVVERQNHVSTVLSQPTALFPFTYFSFLSLIFRVCCSTDATIR
jgi:hypothetical protein